MTIFVYYQYIKGGRERGWAEKQKQKGEFRIWNWVLYLMNYSNNLLIPIHFISRRIYKKGQIITIVNKAKFLCKKL